MSFSPPEVDREWLKAFFSAPNTLTWDALEAGTARRDQIEAVTTWITRLSAPTADAPVILPFYGEDGVSGWYATALTLEGEQQLRATLRAWLGPSYLTQLQPADDSYPGAKAMRERFGREVIWFTGPEPNTIAARLALLNGLDAHRPRLPRSEPRPVGRIRIDLERALLAREEATALALVAELRATGRLNEENLQFLDVRLKAGLGHWQQIARNHWAIKNLSDLPLPPQTLADLVEALYRVFIDDLEVSGDPAAVLAAFSEDILHPFPRLFASRHGVRTPRIVKAFLLYESLQTRPNDHILTTLTALLPMEEAGWAARFLPTDRLPPSTAAIDQAVLPAVSEPAAEPAPPASVGAPPIAQPSVPTAAAPNSSVPTDDEAELAYEDGQIDRAFEIDLSAPLHRKSLMRLLSCAQFIGTATARARVLAAFDAQPEARAAFSDAQVQRVEALRAPTSVVGAEKVNLEPSFGWLEWARRLSAGQSLETATADALDNRATWEITALRTNALQCAEFADLIGNLEASAAEIARQALPIIVSAFFPEDAPPTPATKHLASVILLLIALDEATARTDLETLSTVLSALLELGLSSADYQSLIADLNAVQERVASYANLAWSLDVCEVLAISPAPSPEAIEARLRYFLSVVGHCQSFAHRLGVHDFLPIEYLARDFGVDPASIAALRPTAEAAMADASGSDLAGKLVGIYTLTETAGARASAALKVLFPKCTVEVNSDKVNTASLTNLARTADIFVFAWRSSSHQAFYCVKEALGGRDPIYAAGKGTASLVNAVREAAA